MNKKYIYARVSTDGQSTDPQVQSLTSKFPDALIVTEICSGAKQRPMLKSLVANLQSGDTLVVAALDRLGRKTTEVLSLIENLEKHGTNLVSVREGVDYSTITGRLVTRILASVTEMERALISERTKAGLMAAKAQGRLGGRPKTIPQEKINEGIKLVNSGMSIRKAAKKIGISDVRLGQLIRNSRYE